MDALTNCGRHEAFESKRAAQAALASMKRRIRNRGDKVVGSPGVFKCKTGASHWHIGRRNGRRGR